jgi:hypothetical protein
LKYQPGQAQDLRAELDRLRRYLDAPTLGYFYMETLNAAPARVEEGMTVKADGVNWNPGGGAGLYQYRAGAWVLVG